MTVTRFNVTNPEGETVATHTTWGDAWADARDRMGTWFPTRDGRNFDVVRVGTPPPTPTAFEDGLAHRNLNH